MEDMEMVNAGFTRENTVEDERGGAWAELPGMMTPAQPAKKKAKKASLSVVEMELNAYIAKMKQAKKRCRMVTFRSKTASEKWAKLTGTA
jgi:hypothetical protein